MQIETVYRTGAIARCIEMHALYYAKAVGFGRAFEAKVAGELGEFAGRLDKPVNGFWMAVNADTVIGTVAIDGEDLGEGRAHLRWFIIGDAARGTGVGRSLLTGALAFCDRLGFQETHLWTFEGLDTARHLYETHGFTLVEQRKGTQWGSEVLEQRFTRTLPAKR